MTWKLPARVCFILLPLQKQRSTIAAAAKRPVQAAWRARRALIMLLSSSQARALNLPLVGFLACRTSYISLLLTHLVGFSHLRAYTAGATAPAKFALRSYHLRCASLGLLGGCTAQTMSKMVWQRDFGLKHVCQAPLLCDGTPEYFILAALNLTVFFSCSVHLLQPPINQAVFIYQESTHFIGHQGKQKFFMKAATGVHHAPPTALQSCLQP